MTLTFCVSSRTLGGITDLMGAVQSLTLETDATGQPAVLVAVLTAHKAPYDVDWSHGGEPFYLTFYDGETAVARDTFFIDSAVLEYGGPFTLTLLREDAWQRKYAIDPDIFMSKSAARG